MSEQPTLAQMNLAVPTLEQFISQQVDQSPPQYQLPLVSKQELRQIEATNSAQFIRRDFLEACQEYNESIVSLNDILGRIYRASQLYADKTGQAPPEFELHKFLTINIPKLLTGTSQDIPTTQAAMMNYQASFGKKWE